MPALTIDQLIFKGTHNSYACRGREPPWMNHPPEVQIDDFGVWAIELDYSLGHDRGAPVPVVGHDRGGERSCWGYYLSDYLERILRAKALAYRPVFVCVEVKAWKRRLSMPWRTPVDRRFSWHDKWQAGLDAFRAACGDRFVLLEDWLAEHDRRWPLPGDLAGKVVLYEPNKVNADGLLAGLRGTHANHFVTPDEVEAAIATGRPLERNGAPCEDGARVLRLDQYQADWTFDYGVPPNPLVVDAAAPDTTVVSDAEGKPWRWRDQTSHGHRVSPHGTYRFPYRMLAEAVERARGITPATNGHADPRRAGQDWTVLLLPASHHEAETPLDFPLRILKCPHSG